MQTDFSFFIFLVPGNWDIKMPGILLLSKTCDKCRRNSQMTKVASVELPKSQMLLSKEYQLGFEGICGLSLKQEGQVG